MIPGQILSHNFDLACQQVLKILIFGLYITHLVLCGRILFLLRPPFFVILNIFHAFFEPTASAQK